MELERRVHAMLEENELLQNTVDGLRERTLVLERQCHEKDLQVRTQAMSVPSTKVTDSVTFRLSALICSIFSMISTVIFLVRLTIK